MLAKKYTSPENLYESMRAVITAETPKICHNLRPA